MIKKILMLFFMGLLLCSFAFWGTKTNPNQKVDRHTKLFTAVDGDWTSVGNPPNPIYGYTPMVLEGPKVSGDYVIGPEISTQLNGYYNYQWNGNNGHYVYKNPTTGLLHAIYMYSSDSTNISSTRRTGYAASTDDGTTWTYLGDAPTGIRSGFCSLAWKTDGNACVFNHMVGSIGATITSFNHYDIVPGSGTFQDVEITHTPSNFVWPIGVTLSNGNIHVMGTTYQGSAATDTLAFELYNSTTNTFGSMTRWAYLNPASDQNNESMSDAAGTGGKAIMLLNPYRETSGNWGTSRIFVSTTSNNGANWTYPPTEVFNPHVISGDSIAPNVNGSCDVVMDDAGNYYYAFNSNGPSGFFAAGRLLVSKNGTEPGIVCGTGSSPINPIPEAATTMLAQAFISSIDHPCLSISDDGLYLFVSYSVTYQTDTCANGFQKAHIYYSFCQTSNMTWSAPIRVTNAGPNSFDEKYSSLNRRTAKVGSQYNLYLTYQKCAQAGNYCTATPDQPVIRRAYLMFRKITDATTIGINNNSNVVKEFKLNQNYPNPFNPITTITYNLPVTGDVTLKVYNILGSEVATLVNGVEVAGTKSISFNANNFASGIYFYTLKSGSFTDTKKMILIK